MNREHRRRRWASKRPTVVTCLRVEPTERGYWEVSYARHVGTDVHDLRACAEAREVIALLVASEGTCGGCGAVGLVLGTSACDALARCGQCTLLMGQQMVAAMVSGGGKRMREN